MNKPFRIIIISVVITFQFLMRTSVEAAVPTIEDLEKITIIGPLPASVRKKMEEYIGYYVNRMKSAKNFKEVIQARKKLIKGYSVHNSSYWQSGYADICADRLLALLDVPDVARQIQAAITLANMPQYTIQPAIERMAKHSNPAVRYWAVKAYKASIRRMVLYDARAEKMFQTLKRLGMTDSGPILMAVLRCLTPYPDMDEKTISTMKSIFDEVWLARCKDVYAGKVDVIQTYHKMVRFLIPFSEEDKKRILQLLADALEASSLGFINATNRKNLAAKRLMELLIALENKLADITATSETPILKILDEKISLMEKAIKARLKVNEYWKPILAKHGIKLRFHAPKKSTTTKPTVSPSR